MARKLLNGNEIAGFVKNRQAKQVRTLRQAHHIIPKLVVIKSENSSQVIETYVRMKQRYAEDILIETEVISCSTEAMPAIIQTANDDDSVQAVIVQLPLDDVSQTQMIVSLIAPEKDVDGLGPEADFISATAEAIDWLLSGYGVDLKDKKITLLGRGKLVGAPLEKLWKQQNFDVTILDKQSEDVNAKLLKSQIIVSAVGQAGILNNDNVAKNAVVVDAGTVSEDGVILGDATADLQARRDLIITPTKGGVGPLTIVLLFDHVIQACLKRVEK